MDNKERLDDARRLSDVLTEQLKRQIRWEPWKAMAVAAGAGAGIAMAMIAGTTLVLRSFGH
jgi:hypothetical protein